MDKLCRLMSPDLPLTIEPKRLAMQGATFTGQYAIDEMQRLGALLHNKTGEISFHLNFTHDEDSGISFIMGKIQTSLNTVCQRCLGFMTLNIERSVYLGILDRHEEFLQLPDNCEPLILDKQSVTLNDLIEDEVILALPIAPLHDLNKCSATPILKKINTENKYNPFSILQRLVHKPKF
jgi:uncharacterized protein